MNVHETGAPGSRVEIRIHYPRATPTLIYLPGLHGDWTLVGSFRRALAGRVRFVEMTYPRTLTWSLGEYAAQIENALARQEIESGWLLGESFGSQVVWAMAQRKVFRFAGLILAGGFVRHPAPWAVPVVEQLAGLVPPRLLRWITFCYGWVMRLRFRTSPEVLASLGEFISRRTDLDARAARHRLRLIAENDLCVTAAEVTAPVYMLSGLLDPIVPWPWVRHWTSRHCPALRQYRVLWRADHTVLGTAPDAAAEQVLAWMQTVAERPSNGSRA
jgi:pimeloyl-ACP methyl ester carboxylesterase